MGCLKPSDLRHGGLLQSTHILGENGLVRSADRLILVRPGPGMCSVPRECDLVRWRNFRDEAVLPDLMATRGLVVATAEEGTDPGDMQAGFPPDDADDHLDQGLAKFYRACG
jgi:hypothetical protein